MSNYEQALKHLTAINDSLFDEYCETSLPMVWDTWEYKSEQVSFSYRGIMNELGTGWVFKDTHEHTVRFHGISAAAHFLNQAVL